jgi:hypothetical protein
MRRAPSVLESGWFSKPPKPGDLAGLTLEDADVEAARQCRPGDCALKLASGAMDRIRTELAGPPAQAKPKATALVRQMLVEYVAAYQTGGIDKFGPKPTISVYHLTLWQDPQNPGRTVVCSKRIYASHYFQSGFDLVALVDAPAGQKGFYLMDLHRVRIDPPTGMLSGVLLGKIRGGIETAVTERVTTAKALAEKD